MKFKKGDMLVNSDEKYKNVKYLLILGFSNAFYEYEVNRTDYNPFKRTHSIEGIENEGWRKMTKLERAVL